MLDLMQTKHHTGLKSPQKRDLFAAIVDRKKIFLLIMLKHIGKERVWTFSVLI